MVGELNEEIIEFMERQLKKQHGLMIVLHNDITITTQDTLNTEDEAIEQMMKYGLVGYYSRTKQVYYPSSSIKQISLLTIE